MTARSHGWVLALSSRTVLIAVLSGSVGAQATTRATLFKHEHGVLPFVGAHAGIPEGVSATVAGAVGLGTRVPGFFFVAIEPGYGAGRRSIGWLLRFPDNPLEPFGEFGFGTSLRISQLTMYRNGALFPPGLRYYGPELQVSLGFIGARLGVYAGSGSSRSPVAVALAIGGGA